MKETSKSIATTKWFLFRLNQTIHTIVFVQKSNKTTCTCATGDSLNRGSRIILKEKTVKTLIQS